MDDSSASTSIPALHCNLAATRGPARLKHNNLDILGKFKRSSSSACGLTIHYLPFQGTNPLCLSGFNCPIAEYILSTCTVPLNYLSTYPYSLSLCLPTSTALPRAGNTAAVAVNPCTWSSGRIASPGTSLACPGVASRVDKYSASKHG
jgi:hypothetical protein